MSLTEIYRRYRLGKTDLVTAAAEFGFSGRGLAIRLAKWGDKLPKILLTLDQIVADKIDRDKAALALGVSTRQVNKLTESWGVQRPIKQYLFDREVTRLKWGMRKKFAVDYIAGTVSLNNAANAAGVSSRQMRRWVSDLLMDHHGIVFKDLAKLSIETQHRLAKEIASGEQIDVEGQSALLKIAAGEISMADEAASRVTAKATRRRLRGG